MKKIKINKWAFTLVEFIIVVAILSVLMTISYNNFSHYTMKARDTSRILDIASIEKTLHAYEARVWNYPDPSDYKEITYSWSSIWKQWTVWESIFHTLKLNKIPRDPLSDDMFSYSVLAKNNNKFEIATIMEWEENLSKIFDNTYASNSNIRTRIIWNYDSKTAHNYFWDNLKIIALPSISNWDSNLTSLSDIIDNKTLIYTWCQKLPASYENIKNEEEIDNSLFIPKKILLFDWVTQDLIIDEDKQRELLLNIKEAYQGTAFEEDKFIWELINLNINDNNLSYKIKELFKQYSESNFEL